jgi:serine-type D-Ala-D-Ala carboxypeptidase
MDLRSIAGSILFFLMTTCGLTDASSQKAHVWSESDFEPIAALAKAEIEARRIPGAVIVIGTKNNVLYRAAYGYRMFEPAPVTMTVDTIFDLASVTKVAATTTAIMQLVERKKVNLADRVIRYWPQFGANEKTNITLQHLLTHYSGLRADLDLKKEWSGYHTAMNMIVAEKPVDRPGVRYIYSDINFEILGELIRRVTKSELDQYCLEHVFGPMKMIDTGFRPSPELRSRIAPTRDMSDSLLWGEVHDPTARRMGGVAGHAGLFATADDLAIYGRMLLNGGIENGARILRTKSVELMTARHSPENGPRARGYGWDLGGTNGYSKAPAGTYGHFGFTGTMIWIDPTLGTYAIVLTNRVYFGAKGEADPLRQAIIKLLENLPSQRNDR